MTVVSVSFKSAQNSKFLNYQHPTIQIKRESKVTLHILLFNTFLLLKGRLLTFFYRAHDEALYRRSLIYLATYFVEIRQSNL